MSDENVTFVGGHAESQTEAVETNLPADDREAAIAEVKKAIKDAAEAEGKSSVKEADDALEKDQYSAKPKKDPKTGKFLPKDVKSGVDTTKSTESTEKNSSNDEEVDLDEVDLKKVLKQREKLAAAKQKQQQEYQQFQMRLQQEWQQVQQAKAEAERARKELEELRRNPVQAIKKAGWDPEDLIVSLANDGTPEGKMQAMLRQLQMQQDEINNWKKSEAEKQQQAQQQAQQQQLAQYRQYIENKFINHIGDEEKFPHIQNFYKGRESSLIAEGDMVAAQYRELTGKEASVEDIAEYIEEVLAERSRSWYERNKSSKVNAPNVSGKPARGSSGKTLTNTSASDRRSVGKDLKDLDGEDRLEAARAAVAAALSESETQD
jgi:hypothetical protein